MAQMRMIDLGQVYGDAAQIQGARQRNELLEMMAPLKVEGAQLRNEAQGQRNRLADLTMDDQVQQTRQQTQMGDMELTDADRQQAAYESQLFLRTLGEDFDQLPPEQRNQRWSAARQRAIEMDPEDAVLPEQFDPNAYRNIAAMASMGLEDEGPNVGAQKILEDGTIIQSTEAGPRVWSPTGEVLSGQAAADAVRAARDYQVSNQRNIYGARREGTLGADINLGGAAEGSKAAGKQAIEQSGQMFDQLGNVKGSIANIDEAIRLIDEGAGTGPVMSRLPSIRSASVQLDNLQGRMGLDVINSTTFGALSEAELRFALSTALPENLDGPELKSWLQRKKASQERLANYLQEAATFLGRPGNSVAEWMDLQRGRGGGGGSGVDDILSKYGVE